MRKQASLVILALLLLISITAVVSAGSVELEIITYANHDVTVNILDPVREDPLLMTLEDNTGQDATATFNFETAVTKIDIWVGVKKSGRLVVSKKFTGYTSNGQISLTVLKESTTTTNQTANSTNQTENNATANQTAIVTTAATTDNPSINQTSNNETSGDATGSDFPVMKVVIYTLAILAILLIIAGVILFLVFRDKSKVQKDVKVKKYSELKEEIKERNKTAEEKKIDELESKIKGLQEEVEGIKNKKSKIKEVEERIKKDMAELEKLKK